MPLNLNLTLCKAPTWDNLCTANSQRLFSHSKGLLQIKSLVSWSHIREDLRQALKEVFRINFGADRASKE